VPATGEYDTRVVVLTRSQAAENSYGERVESWPDPDQGTGEYWAKRVRLTGGEQLAAAVRQTVGTIGLAVQGEADVTVYDRIRIKATGVVYSVSDVWFDRGGWETQLVCSLVG
jgi:SPP1 family predicted phage head-tail adaptor